MKKNKFLPFLTVTLVIVSLSGCKSDSSSNPDTNTAIAEITSATTSIAIMETTTAPQVADVGIETLAEGEERDYKVEDILKNDLEIDGIPITIPCTLSELLESLGDDYSVKKSDIKLTIEGTVNSKFNDFTGEFVIAGLYYNGKDTYCSAHALIANPKKIDYDAIKVIGYFSGSGQEVGNLSLPDLTRGDSLDKCIKKYGNPDNVNLGKNGKVYLSYYDYDENDKRTCWLQITVKNNIIDNIWAEFETEDIKND